MKRLALVITASLVLALGIIGCSQTQTPIPKTDIPPNLTYVEVLGVVRAATKASTLAIRNSSGYFKAVWYPSSRQWHVTAWGSEEDSGKYLGITYIVDDATGKVLNPPPAFTAR